MAERNLDIIINAKNNATKELNSLKYVTSGFEVCLDFHQHNLPLDRLVSLQFNDFQYVDEFIQLLGDLLKWRVFNRHHNGHSGYVLNFGGANGERFDIESSTGEKASHPRKYTWLILHQY
jgi:hypothetical protein